MREVLRIKSMYPDERSFRDMGITINFQTEYNGKDDMIAFIDSSIWYYYDYKSNQTDLQLEYSYPVRY